MKKLNWTAFNNPMGWVEPTYRCQYSCIGCYRGCGILNHPNDMKLSELKNQIIWLKNNRKVTTISIGGGEPLLYEPIIELVRFIKEIKLKCVIQTNGLLLNDKLLKKFDNLKLDEILIHISEHQGVSDIFTRKDKICELFRLYPNIKLGFIQPGSKLIFDKLDEYFLFYKENLDIVTKVTFCNYKDNPIYDKDSHKELEVGFDNLINRVIEITGIKFHSYLQKIESKNKCWLFSTNYYDKITKEFLGSYQNRSDINKFKDSYRQDLILLDPPNYFNDLLDFCEGCPDAMIYEDHLLPSCVLERFKRGEYIGQIKIT